MTPPRVDSPRPLAPPRLVPARDARVADRVGRVERAGGQRRRERERLRDLVDRPDLAQLARQAVQLAPVVGHLDPVADAIRRTPSRPPRHAQLGPGGVDRQHGAAIEALSRDHLNVAVPERARIVDLDAVEAVLGPAVAAVGRDRARVVARGTPPAVVQPAGRRGVRSSQPAMSPSGVSHVRPFSPTRCPAR